MKNKLKVIEIGNSKGLRLGTAILKFLDDPDYLEVELIEDKIVLSKIKESRSDWEQCFKKATTETGLNNLSLEINDISLDFSNDWDEEEDLVSAVNRFDVFG